MTGAAAVMTTEEIRGDAPRGVTMEEIRAAFIDMIRIPSVTGSAGEEEACAYLEKLLSRHGIAGERIAKIPSRPNLLAVLRAGGGKDALESGGDNLPPMVLISHIDVVDGDPGKWTHPVFGAVSDAGRIWGRGTLDTKHLTMMELYAFLRLAEMRNRLSRDVYFLATIDEEGGSAYGMEYVKSVRPELFAGAYVINEGGGFPLHINGRDYMMLTVGEKAVCKVRIWAEGTGGHASAPGDDQAMLKLAEGLERIFASEAELNCGSRRTHDTMREIVGSDEWDNPVGADIYGYAGQNSIGMRNYQIGERSNVIPARAETVLEFRVLPYASEQEIAEYLGRQLAGLPVRYEIMSYEPGFESHFENSRLKEFIGSLNEACARRGFSGRVLPMLALGRTDGRFFGSEGSMVYGCSPLLMGDSFDVVLPKVHGCDESILEESFTFGCQVLCEVIEKNCLKEENQ